MQFGKAFTFVFDDPDWIKKLGIAALVALIPVLGGFLLTGWALEITRRVIADESDVLPDWDNFSEYLTKGFFASLALLVYYLPLILIFSCGQVGVIILATAAADGGGAEAASAALSIAGLCLVCVYIILGVGVGIIAPAAFGNLAASGEIGAAFRFGEVFGLVRAAPGAYLMVVLGGLLVGFFLAPLGLLACGVGLFFTAAYASAVSFHLIGQAYLAAKAAQGA